MTADQVRQRVLAEIGDQWEKSNAHGVDLRKCLVDPEKHKFRNGCDENVFLDLWLVLEEDPGNKSGYKIVYDEEDDNYGLAMSDVRHGLTYIGTYGTFMETLQSM